MQRPSRPLAALLVLAAMSVPAAAQDLTALYSDDATEDTGGVFLTVNQVQDLAPNWRPIPVFAERQYLMRPFALDVSAAPHTRFRLSQKVVYADRPILEVYLPDGTPIPLPAEFPRASVPPLILVSAKDTGDALLRLRGLKDAGGPAPVQDDVLVRVGPFPGLAGRSLGTYPFFEYTRAINENAVVETALDPVRHQERLGLPYDCYVVAHRTPTEWAANPVLTDLTATVETATVNGTSIASNVLAAWSTGLQGDAGLDVGVPYDVVYDFGQDGILDPGDLIDGFHFDEAGFYVVEDTTQLGPLPTTSFEFDDPSLFYTEGFDGGTTRSMRSRGVVVHPDPLPPGVSPLVTFSHGNTGIANSYQGYQYLQDLLASYGFVTASFDMFPAHVSLGIRWRGWLTNKNTERLLLQTLLKDHAGNPYPPMGGGVLDGRIDPDRIVTIGHSRGGEGVIVQYNQVAHPTITDLVPPNGTLAGFDEDSFLGIGSFAQTTFLTAAQGSKTDDVPFLMFFGSSDNDVCGCSSGVVPTVHYNRAQGDKAMLYLYGAGHGYFNTLWSCTCTGPFTMLRNEVEAITQGYLLPWVLMAADGNRPGRDFFARSPDVFRPIGCEFVPAQEALVNLWRDGLGRDNFVVEDYDTNTANVNLSSSGQPVSFTILNLFEGNFGDTNPSGGWSAGEPDGGFWWETAGAIWDYNGTSFDYVLTLDPDERDLSDDTYLSFVTCQQSGHPDTNAIEAPRAFTVTLRDTGGGESSIRTSEYGGIDEPYRRQSNGWGSALKTYRLRLADFLADGAALDLRDVQEIRFEFGSDHGAPRARLGFDDIEIVR